MTPDDLRARILHVLINNTPPKYLAMPEDLSNLTTALIEELGPPSIPDRSFMDDQGRTWEWCGGQPGTWAWRITANGPAE